MRKELAENGGLEEVSNEELMEARLGTETEQSEKYEEEKHK